MMYDVQVDDLWNGYLTGVVVGSLDLWDGARELVKPAYMDKWEKAGATLLLDSLRVRHG
jgi:hypothetical protein